MDTIKLYDMKLLVITALFVIITYIVCGGFLLIELYK